MAPAGMECTKCGASSPPGLLACPKCATPFEVDPGATMAGGQETDFAATEWSAPDAAAPAGIPSGPLLPGAVLGARYEILELLGEGGMGAVFRARDRELDRDVALKVIRPELADKPGVLDRFKQEIILARQVTHRNVIRIFDLGTADGIKFITMEFIEGQVLKTLLRERGKYSPEEAADLMMAVAEGLDAAHREKVIHRDLKPQNIMVDTQGRALVMDFGLADFAAGTEGAAHAGSPMGTPDYMSPEQVRCEDIDARSDVFTMGVILYELLTGKLPFDAPTPLGAMLQRVQKPARPPIEADPAIPKALNEMVVKCMAMDPAARYHSAGELLHALQVWRGVLPKGGLTRTWKWITASLAALLVVAGGIATREILNKPPPKQNTVTVLVADFDNRTGDPVFDRTLEPMFSLALEGASFITSMRRDQAMRIAGQLQRGSTSLDEPLARLVATREGISIVVAGSIARSGGGYEVSVRAIDTAKGEPVAVRNARASDREGVLRSVGRLAAPIRRALGDATPEAAQVAAAETYSAASLEAAHTYAVAQERMWSGALPEAIQGYKQAVKLDPNMGRAWAGLAVAHSNLKKYPEAGEYYKKALALLDRLSERERYRTLGTYYISYARNYPQAIETLRKLVSQYPADTAGFNNLSVAYALVRNVPEAAAASRRALELSPNNVQNRLNFAVYSMLAGSFDNAAAEAQRILKQNPNYEFAFLPLALSTLARGDVQGAREVYARLAKLSPQGYSLAKAGEADLEMYLGRSRAALQVLQEGLQADRKENNSGEMAVKYVAMAEAQLALGRRAAAAASAARAAELDRTESILYPAARILLEAGEEAKARAIATSLETTLQSQAKSYARLITGEIALRHERTGEAVDAFQEAQKLLDSWSARFLLGRAYAQADHFAEAIAHLDNCLKRSGEAADLFFSDTATLRYLPPLYYWLGRAQEGLGSAEAARDNYRKFLQLRAGADPGAPLVAEAKARAGGVPLLR